MERDELRLECIKLAASKSPDHSEALARAEQYFEFVKRPEGSSKQIVGENLKHTGNSKNPTL